MRHSETIGALATALATAQAQFTNPPRNREVTVLKKAGGTYTFSYATFDTIVDMVRPALSGNGLCYVQVVDLAEHGSVMITTKLMHSSGEWIEGQTPVLVKDDDGPQAFGSAMTYARRYGLTALLGVASEEDDDANGAEGNQAEGRNRGTTRAAAPAPAPKEKSEVSEAREMYKKLAAAIDTAPHLTALNSAMQTAGQIPDSAVPKPGSDLDKLRKVNAEGWHMIVDRANKRRVALAAAPTTAA